MDARITPESKVTAQHTVRCYETDAAMRLKPAAFMDLAQEMAYVAADAMHFGYEELMCENKAWVLSRLHFVFEDVPSWRDRLELQTWHKGPRGPFYIRDFRFLDQEGHTRISATSSWVILDVKERRMCRTSEVTDMIPETTVCLEDSIAEPAGKVAVPRGSEPVLAGCRRVGYSDVDLQGHTNNARYMVWAMDCIDFEEAASRPVREVRIQFNHETCAGEEVSLYLFRDGDTYYVEGRAEDRQAFCARIDF